MKKRVSCGTGYCKDMQKACVVGEELRLFFSEDFRVDFQCQGFRNFEGLGEGFDVLFDMGFHFLFQEHGGVEMAIGYSG